MSVLFNFIVSCGIGIIIFMLIPLFKIKPKNIQDKLLISILIVILNYLCILYTSANHIHFLTLFFFIFNDPLEFILGPLLYIYVKSLISQQSKIIYKYKYHFFPAFLFLWISTIPTLISYLQENYIFEYVKYIDNKKVFPVFYILYLITYITLSLKAFIKYESRLKNQFSTIHKHKSIWIKRMLTGILIVCLLDFFALISDLIFNFKIDISEYSTPFASVIFVYYLGYNAINKTQLLIPLEEEQTNVAIKNTQKNSPLFTAQEISKYHQSIHQHLEVEKLYLNEDLNLLLLSKKIGISDKKLSSYINNILKTTFYDLINHYRIKAVKEKLSNPKYNDLTIIAIANDCGFKSKTTFNRIFKKETNMLPSTYKKAYQKPLKKSTIASFEPLNTYENI